MAEKAYEYEKKKEFMFRGKSTEELKKLDIREFAKYLTSRERRTILRNFDVVERFTKRCLDTAGKNRIIRTNMRDIVIVPKLVGLTIQVHNGKEFMPLKVEAEMIGHRLGEFAFTRRPVKHGAPGIGATRSSASLSVK